MSDVIVSSYKIVGGTATPQADLTLVFQKEEVETLPGATTPTQGWGAAATATTAQPAWH
jgi:hypothetical protein